MIWSASRMRAPATRGGAARPHRALLVLLALVCAGAWAGAPPGPVRQASASAAQAPASLRGERPDGDLLVRDGRPARARLPTFLRPAQIASLKTAVAVATTLLLLWGILLRRAGRPVAYRRCRDHLLLALGLLGGLCWWNALHFHNGTYVHWWEVYHHYVGVKYFPELGYRRLYICAVVADAQDGALGDVQALSARDLETNRLVRVPVILADPTRCTTHFSPDRWAAFKHDNAWFRDQMTPARWARARRDHGYNATPVWGVLGHLLASRGPASAGLVLALTLVDPLLLLLMWGAVLWAFGWRVMCVAMVYWGTNYPAEFAWLGGAYLRQDWLAMSVIGICLLRRDKMAAGGFALTAAALLRVFPALLVVGIALKAFRAMWGQRTFLPPAEYRKFGIGAAAALAILLPASWLVLGGWGSWPAFLDNSRKYLDTPFTTGMGLRPIVAYEHHTRARFSMPQALDEDPSHTWRETRRRVFHERRYLFAALVLGFVLLLGRAVKHEPPWAAAALATGLIPVTGELASYYYSVLLVFGLLWARYELVGAGLCALAALTSVMPSLLSWNDEKYGVMSVATVAFVALVTWHVAAPPPPPTGGDRPSAAPAP